MSRSTVYPSDHLTRPKDARNSPHVRARRIPKRAWAQRPCNATTYDLDLHSDPAAADDLPAPRPGAYPAICPGTSRAFLCFPVAYTYKNTGQDYDNTCTR